MNIIISLAILLASTGVVFFASYISSGRQRLPGADTALFFATALNLTIINAVGFILQVYLAHLIDWSSYNVHDILVGPIRGQIDDVTTIIRALPEAAVTCGIALAVAQFCYKPINFSLAFAFTFFVTLSLYDFVSTLAGAHGQPPISQSILANAVGAPFEAAIATAFYFLMSSVIDRVQSNWFGAFSIFLFSAMGMLGIVITLFVFEKIFLVTDPSYFEADISPGATMPILWSPPLTADQRNVSMKGAFYALNTQHDIGTSLYVWGDKRFHISLKRGKADYSPSISVYAFENCSDVQVQKMLGHFNPTSPRSATVGSLEIESLTEDFSLLLTSKDSKNMLMSGKRTVDAEHSLPGDFVVDKKSHTVGWAEVFSDESSYFIRPTGKRLALALSLSNYINKRSHDVVSIRIDGRTVRLSSNGTSEFHGGKCALIPLDLTSGHLPSNGQAGSSFGAIVVLLDFLEGHAESPPTLNFSGNHAIFSIDSIKLSDPYAKPDDPIVSGALRFLSVKGGLDRVHLYGAPVSVSYTGFTTFWGDSFDASIGADGILHLKGNISGISTDGDRMMKTSWELMDPGLQIFFLTGIVAVLGVLVRYMAILFIRNEEGKWRDWDF